MLTSPSALRIYPAMQKAMQKESNPNVCGCRGAGQKVL